MNQINFKCHSVKQETALFSQKKFTVLGTGIQFGKTTVGAMWMKMFIHTFTSHDDHFLILAPTYKVLSQSTLPAFLSIMEGYGEFKRTESIFYVYGGGKIFIRSTTDPDAMVGITNVRAIWADEAGIMSLYAFENMQARSSFMKAPIMLTTSPYSLNWVYKDLIIPTKKNFRDDVCLVQAASVENPYFPRDEYEERRKTMDPRRFKMIYGGEFERPEGLVYGCIDDHHKKELSSIELPSGTKFYGGVDWGYRDPWVLTVRAITPAGWHWDIHEHRETHLTMPKIKEITAKINKRFPMTRIEADPSRPDCIEELCSVVPTVPADNDIEKGIRLHYELISSGKYGYSGDCAGLGDEYETYKYPEERNLRPSQNLGNINIPVDQDNHSMDTVRYLTLGTYKKENLYKARSNPETMPKNKFVIGQKQRENGFAEVFS